MPALPRSPDRPAAEALAASALLLSTVAVELKLPVLHVGPQNLVVPLAGLALLALDPARARAALVRRRFLLVVGLCLAAWTAVCALAGELPVPGLGYAVRVLVYGLGFAGLAALASTREGHARLTRLLLGFLLLLAVGGLLETAFPASALFRLLRNPLSFTILPRVASFQSWPTAFGLAMAAATLLSAGLHARGRLGSRAGLLLTTLFVTQVAQSGTRNAWATLVVGLGLAMVRGLLSPRRAIGVGAILLLACVTLPVPSWQLGLRERAPVVAKLVPKGALEVASLAPPRQSLSQRSQLWRAAVAGIRAHPWMGLGPGVFSARVAPHILERPGMNTHNLALNLLVELGVPGLALVVAGLFLAWRLAPPGPTPAGILVAAFLVGQIFDCLLYDAISLALMLTGLALFTGPDADPA